MHQNTPEYDAFDSLEEARSALYAILSDICLFLMDTGGNRGPWTSGADHE